MFVSDGYEGEHWLGVRPVAYLKSTVSENDLTISRNGTEEEWATTIPDSFTAESIYAGRVTAKP